MTRLVFAFVCLFAAAVRAEAPATQPASRPSPYRIIAETRTDPPMRLWVLQVDLGNPATQVKVSPGGEDPDGAGPWQTTLMVPSEIAQRESFDVTVNASFFAVDKEGDWKGKGYTTGQPAAAVGWTMTDGRQWSRREDAWPVFWIDDLGKPQITETKQIKGSAQQMVAGNCWLLRGGHDETPEKGVMTVRHPRTAIGIDPAGKTLTILTVDGRQPGVSIGMTGKELVAELQKYGVTEAINLDGGGSTTLVERDATSGELKIINKPSEGKQRPVANVVGIKVE